MDTVIYSYHGYSGNKYGFSLNEQTGILLCRGSNASDGCHILYSGADRDFSGDISYGVCKAGKNNVGP